MKIGIAGASGYSGETLVQALLKHPIVTLGAVTSRQLVGKALSEVMPQLTGMAGGDLKFTPSDPDQMAADKSIDLWFLALPHGVSAEYVKPLVAAGKKVIDLSADFRLSSPARYEEFYGHPHPAPDLLAQAAYVIPELCNLSAYKNKPIIASPGCYPTSAQIPLIPLIRKGIVHPGSIIINSVSGVSGAGRQAKEFYSFCERDESVCAYGLPKHRHLSEMEEQFTAASGHPVIAQFTPHLVPLKRGIHTTIYIEAIGELSSLDAIYSIWQEAYQGKPFVNILATGNYPDTAKVAYTNRADIAAYHDKRTGRFVLLCAIDNLLKGASGQAIQTMNLINGFPETAGLW